MSDEILIHRNPKISLFVSIQRAVYSAVAIGLVFFLSFQFSPRPGAILIKLRFDQQATKFSKALKRHVSPGVSSILNEHYDTTDDDAFLDVHFPTEIENTDKALTTIIWVHGGGWVTGSKGDIANYLKILARKGYTVVGVDYSVAPKKIYPTPVRQVTSALDYIDNNAERLHVKKNRIILAGDSGGAQIAAQVANMVSVASYAREIGIAPTIKRSQLIGVMLYCGVYDLERVNLDGVFGMFSKTLLWSYSGNKNFMNDSVFAKGSVINFVNSDFPTTFISGGNADPLTPHSRAFTNVLVSHGVAIDSLFFPDDYTVKLPHEYQFNLDNKEGQLALRRSVEFLSRF